MKKVRMLLRVSSDQQLEADGDLSVQRQILVDYISKNPEWVLDEKEYFEGSKSAYKNTSSEREVLQEILQDAANREFDILVPYKDDRVGRLMWDTSSYIMTLKGYGVDVYSVKDGCISPEADDLMGQVMLMFRYANAQKSSADTGMRVRDTAEKLVQKGKFMGGKAPYGYRLVYSGEISKHGRALKHPEIVPEEAEVVRHIYDLSLNKEFGSSKIAKELNMDIKYKNMAPNDHWKGGTITSILTNPIYAGHVAYKRRERINGQYHKLDSKDWVISEERNENIAIIEEEIWDRVQEKRNLRRAKATKSLKDKDVNVIMYNNNQLPLIDVAYCGYCGSKLTRGTKYNYWTIKDTGEKRASLYPVYKCNFAYQGVPHEKWFQFRADWIEPAIFEAIAEYIGILQQNEDIFEEISKSQNKEKAVIERELKRQRQELVEIANKIETIKSKIPDAMIGNYVLSVEQLAEMVKKQEELYEDKKDKIESKEESLKSVIVTAEEWNELREKIPTWQDVFLNADIPTKRVLVNRLIDRIEVKKDEIKIRFKINLDEFFPKPRISGYHGV